MEISQIQDNTYDESLSDLFVQEPVPEVKLEIKKCHSPIRFQEVLQKLQVAFLIKDLTHQILIQGSPARLQPKLELITQNQ